MDNKQKYCFSDFTTDNYRSLLRLAKERYEFRMFGEDSDGSYVIWRHDVDLSPQRALALARIESDEEVRATYFIYTHSEFYNLLERGCSDCVREILDMGHSIGLHFDNGYHGVSDAGEMERLMAEERQLLETVFGASIDSFSFHCTTDLSSASDGQEYAGMVNATSRFYREEVAYCSDSNGIWRFKRLEDVLTSGGHDRLQVLTHPGLWQDAVMSPSDRYHRCIYGRADTTWKWINEFVRTHGRELIGDK